ncbi:hypothetical protein [Peribacillus glennii]|uniref:Uncharacterized protein n=1 Tax=Peribacillus glennii TaxID=2303991 RepID=A0A372L7Q7_9BACI|nr:hypothetical protein [Peribacillus glennii]RFU61280.1 hypothetical protein D0466_18890 [Peribacillus glennii]
MATVVTVEPTIVMCKAIISNPYTSFFIKSHEVTLSINRSLSAGYAENSAHVTASPRVKTVKIQHMIKTNKNEILGSVQALFFADTLVARQVMYDIMNDSEVARVR